MLEDPDVVLTGAICKKKGLLHKLLNYEGNQP